MPVYKYEIKGGLRWLCKFQSNGRTLYKRGFKTKREAKSFEENMMGRANALPFVSHPTYQDVYYECLNSYKNSDLKQTTLATKTCQFATNILPYFGSSNISSITPAQIVEWQKDMKKKKYSPSYLRTLQSQFNWVINYAVKKGYISQNPLVDVKNMGVVGKRLEFWDYSQYEAFTKVSKQSPFYYTMFEILYWTGMREGEMLALTVGDVDFIGKKISITKTLSRVHGQIQFTTPKTQSSVRTISIPDFLVRELQDYISRLYRPDNNSLLFPIDKSNVIRNFKAMAQAANLPIITVHGLRHSHVSLLISQGYSIFEISKRIGHKSVSTTQDIYGHLMDQQQKDIANTLNEIHDQPAPSK